MRVIIGVIIALALISFLVKKVDFKLPQALPPSPQLALSFTGWQDVVNREYGYSLKMPHDWSQLQMEGEPAYPQRLQVVNVKPEEQQKPHVGIIVTVTVLNHQTLSELPEITELIDAGHEPRQLTIAGSPAMFIDGLGESGEEFSVFITHQDYVYRLDWFGTHPDVRKQYKEVGLKILASLQFP